MKSRLTELESILNTICSMENEAIEYKLNKGYRGGTILSKVNASIKALTELVDNIQKTTDTGNTSKPQAKNPDIPQVNTPQKLKKAV